MRADGEEFGEQRLTEAALTATHSAPETAIAQLLSSVRSFCDAKLHDDATLLTVAVRGVAEGAAMPAVARES